MKPLEKGNVLIISLLIMTVIALISTEIWLRIKTEINQSTHMSIQDRIYLDLQGFQNWAILSLKTYQEKESSTPMPFEPQSFEWGATLSGFWQDQQALFNLNALQARENINAQRGFINLLTLIGKISFKDAEIILQETQRYLDQNENMISVSELKSVPRVTQALFQKIKHYLTALPSKMHKININGINKNDPVVLLTLSGSMTLADTHALMLCRTGFIKEREAVSFLHCIWQKKIPISIDNIAYYSQYFLAVGTVRIASQQHTLYSFLEKSSMQKNGSNVRLLWQSLDAK
jgi:type II secretory pathway component PulK